MFSIMQWQKQYSMGVTLAAGNSLSWYRDTFAEGVDFSELLADIGEVSPGADGLLFTPYIVGERTPYTDSTVRGSFIGIDTHHRRRHFQPSGLGRHHFSLKDSQLIMEEEAKRKFSKNRFCWWGCEKQRVASDAGGYFAAEITTLSTEQGPGMGGRDVMRQSEADFILTKRLV